MLERLLAQPTIERDDLPQVCPGVHEVTGMNEDIAFGHVLDLVVQAVCVGDQYESHCLPNVTMKYIASQTNSMSLGVPEREVFIMNGDGNALGNEQ
jgi:hypothetical protein